MAQVCSCKNLSPIHTLSANCIAKEHQNQRGPQFKPLDEKTDIWGIGQIAWALIANNRDGAVREDRFGPEYENGDRKHIHLGSRYEGTEEELDSLGDSCKHCLQKRGALQ